MPGSYTILGGIATGGMGRVFLARMTGTAGFSRLVAIKRLHPELAAERELVEMLVDEARVTSQIRHSNVVDTLDLVASDGALSLVLEYVEGESLSFLVRRAQTLGEATPRPIAIAILYGVLRGLDAAHEARNEDGEPLGIVHRDVSPQNILVGVDGIPRIIDFGVAKALGRSSFTKPGEVKGKFSYMAPEQLLGRPVTRQVDVYAAGVMLWELLVGRQLFTAEDARVVAAAAIRGDIPRPSEANPSVPTEFDAMIVRATAQDLGERYLTAREFLIDLERHERASDDDVGAWVRRLAAERLAERHRMLRPSAAPTAPPLDDVTDHGTQITGPPLPKAAIQTSPQADLSSRSEPSGVWRDASSPGEPISEDDETSETIPRGGPGSETIPRAETASETIPLADPSQLRRAEQRHGRRDSGEVGRPIGAGGVASRIWDENPGETTPTPAVMLDSASPNGVALASLGPLLINKRSIAFVLGLAIAGGLFLIVMLVTAPSAPTTEGVVESTASEAPVLADTSALVPTPDPAPVPSATSASPVATAPALAPTSKPARKRPQGPHPSVDPKSYR